MESGTATPTEAPAEGNGRPAGETFEVRKPTTGEVLAQVGLDSAERVAEVASRLRDTQGEWEALGFEGRKRWLLRWRDWLLDNANAIADTMQAETGKTRAEASAEVTVLCSEINFYAANGARMLADEEVTPHTPLLRTYKTTVVYRPHQLVGIISPWNFPLLLSLGDAVPALFAGCSVMIKPSEITPLTVGQVIEGWQREVGAPEVLEVVNGMGETGGALVDESDFVQFTGSEATGKKVMARAAETLTPVSLELGGKDPMIVLADADIERAANAVAWGGFINSGQVCMSIERVYVEEPVYDDFLAKLTEKVQSLRQGDDAPTHYTHEVGAMTSPAQVGIVERHVDDARQKGARVLTGGKRLEAPGDFYEPTVIADADHEMLVMRDETFGPVVGVMKVGGEDEAVRLANDTTYGLSASVFSGSKERGEAIARRLEVGAVNVNDALINYYITGAPMGGWKSSGIGTRHGEYGIRKYCRSESIVTQRLARKSELMWFPYSPRKNAVLVSVMTFFASRGRGLRKRVVTARGRRKGR